MSSADRTRWPRPSPWNDALGLHIGRGGRGGCQVFHLLADTLRGLFVHPLLLDGAGLQLCGCFGLQLRLLLGIEGVAFAFPAHFNPGTVVFHVARRVAVKVADVETGLLPLLVSIHPDAVLLSVHDGMLPVYVGTYAA